MKCSEVSTLSPKLKGTKPLLVKVSSSFSMKPPSGPMAMMAGSHGFEAIPRIGMCYIPAPIFGHHRKSFVYEIIEKPMKSNFRHDSIFALRESFNRDLFDTLFRNIRTVPVALFNTPAVYDMDVLHPYGHSRKKASCGILSGGEVQV